MKTRKEFTPGERQEGLDNLGDLCSPEGTGAGASHMRAAAGTATPRARPHTSKRGQADAVRHTQPPLEAHRGKGRQEPSPVQQTSSLQGPELCGAAAWAPPVPWERSGLWAGLSSLVSWAARAHPFPRTRTFMVPLRPEAALTCPASDPHSLPLLQGTEVLM